MDDSVNYDFIVRHTNTSFYLAVNGSCQSAPDSNPYSEFPGSVLHLEYSPQNCGQKESESESVSLPGIGRLLLHIAYQGTEIKYSICEFVCLFVSVMK